MSNWISEKGFDCTENHTRNRIILLILRLLVLILYAPSNYPRINSFYVQGVYHIFKKNLHEIDRDGKVMSSGWLTGIGTDWWYETEEEKIDFPIDNQTRYICSIMRLNIIYACVSCAACYFVVPRTARVFLTSVVLPIPPKPARKRTTYINRYLDGEKST